VQDNHFGDIVIEQRVPEKSDVDTLEAALVVEGELL
jgi:hypothetical protein